MMRIDSVIIKDFRQYKGEQTIQFSNQDNLTVIEGSNGAGKTNLFKALQWCLYGDEILSSDSEKLPLINEQAFRMMGEGDREKAQVEVVLAEGKPKYSITREAKFKKSDGDVEKTYEDLYVMQKEDSGWKDLGGYESEATINRILPKKIRKFYFFDGEQLDAYFRPGTERKVKSTVEEVSQIELLERALEHIETTEDQLSREYQGEIGEKIEEKSNEIQDKKDEIDRLENVLSGISDDIEEINSHLDEINQTLGDTDINTVKSLKQERENLEEEISELNEELDEYKGELREHVIEDAPKVFSIDALKQTQKVIDQKDEEVGLPPNIRATFVKALIDTGECICGHHINDEERENLEEVMRKESVDGISTLAIDGKYKTGEALSETEDFKKDAKNKMSEIRDIEERKNEISSRLSDISQTLKGIGEDEDRDEDVDISKLEERRSSLEKDKEELIRKQGKIEKNLKDAKDKKTELKQERSRLRSRESKNKELDRRMEGLERGQKLLDEVKEDIVQEIRSDIEERTEKQFFELIWKDDFQSVKIADDFSVEVINSYGRNVLNDLSAGERQALALSFMAALKSVSGYDFPVIIDTPLGRISKKPRLNIAENLSGYLSGTQITLLVTNTEYNQDFRQKIEHEVGKEYELKFDGENKYTEIEER